MKRLLALILLGLCLVPEARAAAPTDGEYVLVIGGPSLMMWEKYKKQPHDHWWANFVRAGRIRTEQIRASAGPDAKITWLVYKPGYVDRAAQEKKDLLGFIDSVREKYNLKLIYFTKGHEVINYLNNGQPRDRVKIVNFEFYGHSNAKAFMFDYSSAIESACKSWLHEDELRKINPRAFAKGAFAKSWGCHTGESMSKKWYAALGFPMWGAIGKTQYQMEELPYLVSHKGKIAKWVNR